MIGSHSVILRPDSVSRVRPPMMMMPNTSPEQVNSQVGMDLGISTGLTSSVEVEVDEAEAEAKEGLVGAVRVEVDSDRLKRSDDRRGIVCLGELAGER